jgi:hypothetical protein
MNVKKETMNASVQERFESIAARVNADALLVHRGRYLNADLNVVVGEVAYQLRIRCGRVESLGRQMPLFAPADLVIRAAAEAWEALWQAPPQPGWHDLFALTKRGAMSIEGDSQLLFAHLQYLKDVLGSPRQACPQ